MICRMAKNAAPPSTMKPAIVAWRSSRFIRFDPRRRTCRGVCGRRCFDTGRSGVQEPISRHVGSRAAKLRRIARTASRSTDLPTKRFCASAYAMSKPPSSRDRTSNRRPLPASRTRFHGSGPTVSGTRIPTSGGRLMGFPFALTCMRFPRFRRAFGHQSFIDRACRFPPRGTRSACGSCDPTISRAHSCRGATDLRQARHNQHVVTTSR